MSSKLTKSSYETLIQQNIDWLEANSTDCLERKHIIECLKASVNHEYPPSTPPSRWSVNDGVDPHGTKFNCERAQLAKGHLTDDEIANEVFLNNHNIGTLQAAKDRIRWLSRRLTEMVNISLLKVEAIEGLDIPKTAKAGCMGEFQFTINNGRVCPQCWHEKNDDCELCHGETDENGFSDLIVDVPWDVQKDIWRKILSIARAELIEMGKTIQANSNVKLHMEKGD